VVSRIPLIICLFRSRRRNGPRHTLRTLGTAPKTLHPPGCATALIAVIGSNKIHNLGYLDAVVPVGLGAIIMPVVALLVNNILSSRQYPEFWI
jgi:CBS-domain-containing membrane protein